jgi:hypothetical protein
VLLRELKKENKVQLIEKKENKKGGKKRRQFNLTLKRNSSYISNLTVE